MHADQMKLNFARGGGGDHLSLMRVYNEWVNTNYSTQVGPGVLGSSEESRRRIRARGVTSSSPAGVRELNSL